MEKDKRITIITGHYGSGKTEFALNYALACHEQGESVILADMDIVNTYFRSRERSVQLEKLGISVLSSSIIQDNVTYRQFRLPLTVYCGGVSRPALSILEEMMWGPAPWVV